ncbi:DNA-binding response regulator [Bombiscardovia nodaiensis]|uniref:DNA-binding response regulator n=1 Tax=Bombiscardovia nodaiensis TaxID=2932181 RepID=A0ABM8B700_9BIFI|nr:DNA-binding response regulator [Bombiscardovia nodaiensis]
MNTELKGLPAQQGSADSQHGALTQAREGEDTMKAVTASATGGHSTANQANESHEPTGQAAQADSTPTSASGKQPIRIGVVDDHEMFRAGVIATLQPYFDIVGQAADVDSSIAMIGQTQPDVVLLDVHVPGGQGGGGAEILARSQPLAPRSVFLALSVSDSPQDVGSVIRSGARGYVTKTISASDLVSSIRQVHEGYAVFSPKLAGFVLSAFQEGGSGEDTPAHDDELDRLSAREQEVMRLIARGYTYREVAAELFISAKTVETHVSSVLRKLQLSNRSELTRWAADRRIV